MLSGTKAWEFSWIVYIQTGYKMDKEGLKVKWYLVGSVSGGKWVALFFPLGFFQICQNFTKLNEHLLCAKYISKCSMYIKSFTLKKFLLRWTIGPTLQMGKKQGRLRINKTACGYTPPY